MRKVVIIALAVLSLTACNRKPVQVTGCTTEAISVDASTDALQDADYLAVLAPTKEALAREMDVQIGYLADTFWVAQPECPMLNWASDALWEAAKKACPKKVDMAVVNIGGMRCEWLPGRITRGQIYELMPFDNMLVVLTLKGSDVLDLCQGFADRGGEGVAGLRVKAVDGRLAEVMIDGRAVRSNGLYTVATSDYLMGGADHMDALTRYVDCWKSDLIIRDLYLEAVEQTDTIHAVLDGRMTLL